MALEQSILTATKKNLGLDSSFTAFDPDIITYINGAFSVLHDLGVGPSDGVFIEDADAEWSILAETAAQTAMIKVWLYLKVRMLFDPPVTSFQIDAVTTQLAEYEWRLSVNRDNSVVQVYTDEEVDA